jgi:diacylglycerol kinase family enzyme
MRLILVLNRNAGTLRGVDADKAAADLADIFRSHGHEIVVELQAGKDACAAIERICKAGDFDGLVVGGGDGTISFAAGKASQAGVPLGILPLGTMNLFSRSIGIPLEMKAAAEAIATGIAVPVDICDVNGRLFVHHVTLGLHARMILLRKRLTYHSRLGKIAASVRAWWRALRDPPRLDARIRADGQTMAMRTSAILITNNPLGEGHLPYADDPRQGTLGLYVARTIRPQDLFLIAVRLVLGRIAASPLLDSWIAREVDVTLPATAIDASIDGEIVTLQTPLRCRLHEGGLQVLRPARPQAGTAPGS